MKTLLKSIITVSLASLALAANAGNNDKRGTAGATELLMNPWAKSSGYAGANIAGIRGVEAMRFNVAGISDTSGLSLGYAFSSYMSGSDVKSSSLAFTQSVGKNGTMGLSLMFLQLGEFIETTAEQPEGTGTNFSPSYFNIGFSYAKRFSESIKGGILLRIVNESIRNASASGVAFDAGIQYQPVDFDRFRFGVSLRNVGSSMQYAGDGLAGKGSFNTGNQYTQTLVQRTNTFEMPTTLYIGAAYDLYKSDVHMITGMASFNSHSYTKDRLLVGAEYSMNNKLFLRVGYDYYGGIYSDDLFTNTDVTGGPTAGLTLQQAYGDGDIGRSYGLSYSYRHTSTFGGTHSIGLSFDL